MNSPEQFTPAMAADPSTPPQVLADIAAQRPDLRAAVAANPATYQGLLDWLGGLGDPAVDAALAARGGATPVVEAPAASADAPTAVMPPAAPAPQAPATAFAQQDSGQPAYGQPATAYAGGAPAPAPAGRKKWPWILGIVLVVLIGLGVGLFFLVKGLFTAAEGEYGSDAALDALWDLCEDGDMQACDDLYLTSGFGTEYERFGDTCGDRQGTGQWCAIQPGTYGSDAALDRLYDDCAAGDMEACDELYSQSPGGSEYERFGDTCGDTQQSGQWCATSESSVQHTYGDDVDLDNLWDACGDGNLDACDSLYWGSPFGSEYEEYGSTCGGTAAATNGNCGATAAPAGAQTYGDDPALDVLWDQCTDGNMESCDELFRLSELGSEYEEFGDTCGGVQDPGGNTWCANLSNDTYGDVAELDRLWDLCEDGDLNSCDELFELAPSGSDYQRFADSCGGRQEIGTGAWCA